MGSPRDVDWDEMMAWRMGVLKSLAFHLAEMSASSTQKVFLRAARSACWIERDGLKADGLAYLMAEMWVRPRQMDSQRVAGSEQR